MKIGIQQIKIIKKAKLYFRNINRLGVNTGKSAFCYLAGWDQTLGLCNIRIWNGEFAYMTMFKIFLKEMWLISKQESYVLNNIHKEKFFSKIIITWAKKENFLTNGSLNDDYFKTNSRKVPNSLWFTIYFGNDLPKKIDNNILLLSKKKNILPNFIFLFKNILCAFLKNNGNLKKTVHNLSSHSIFGEMVIEKLKYYLLNKKLSSIILPYEGQPFQQMLFSFVKKINKKVRTIGYAHDAEPLQLHLFHRKGSPDYMLFQGKSRKKYYNKYLNWPAKKLRHIPSIRHRNVNYKHLAKGTIFLPSGIYFEDKIFSEFEKFLSFSKKKSLQPFKVRCHPKSFNAKLQEKVKFKLEKLMTEYSDRFSKKLSSKKSIIAIGAGSLPIIALEKDMEVLHICMEPVIQSYSEEIWPDIKVDQLTSNIFKYKLRRFGKCLTFGKEKNMFNKYCYV